MIRGGWEIEIDEEANTFSLKTTLRRDLPYSKSGKSRLLVTTEGRKRHWQKWRGHVVHVNLQVTIPNVEYDGEGTFDVDE